MPSSQTTVIKNILIVEDDINISNLYKSKLELENFSTAQAFNGLEALEMCKKITYDLILLDLRMPIVDGEKFLGRLRKQEMNSDTPVIVLTNLSREEAPKTLWHNGISGYFVKAHSTPKQLVEIINKTLIQ